MMKKYVKKEDHQKSSNIKRARTENRKKDTFNSRIFRIYKKRYLFYTIIIGMCESSLKELFQFLLKPFLLAGIIVVTSVVHPIITFESNFITLAFKSAVFLVSFLFVFTIITI